MHINCLHIYNTTVVRAQCTTFINPWPARTVSEIGEQNTVTKNSGQNAFYTLTDIFVRKSDIWA